MTSTPPPINPFAQAFNTVLTQLMRINVSLNRLTRQNSGSNQNPRHFNLGFNLEHRIVTLFTSILHNIDSLQSRSLGVGRTSDNTFSTLGNQLLKLPGGFLAGMETGIEAMEAGFQKPTEAILKLGIQAKTAGQNSAKMLRVLSKLEDFGRFTTESLANDLRNFVKTYKFSSEVLTDSLENLSEEFPKFAFLGISEQVAKGSSELIAALQSPQLAGSVTELIKVITEVGAEGLMTASRLGFTQERMAIQNAQSSSDVIRAVISAANKMATSFKHLANGNDKLLSLGPAIENAGGKFGYAAITISEKINSIGIDKLLKVIQENGEYANSFSNFTKQLLDPIYTIANFLLPKIIDIFSIPFIKEIGQIIATTFLFALGRGILSVLAGLFGGAGSLLSATLGPWGIAISVALTGISLLMKKFLSDSEDTTKNTEAIANNTRKQENYSFMASQYTKEMAERSAATVEMIKSFNEQSIKALEAKEQTEKMDSLIKAVLTLAETLDRSKVPVIPKMGVGK